ncbi:hypothetical protein Bsp3421_000325 (plasmid) [Burkholderia sp. FERM BP-3421]|uniref:hypothetical protein n=1 Tax=Burkholderia sp. FERM BP-3421 TaxID=1494466 RepID=UPI00235FD9DB|nr:hypothetical protein [Burkholderia sp. FERM BP-3421]WDD90479.1 hypothetical protein Bsp3421_000325 [Burkholderia sp. FERM BP-3421]
MSEVKAQIEALEIEAQELQAAEIAAVIADVRAKVFVDERSTVGRVPWDQVREVRGAEEMPVHNVGPLARQPTLATLL